MAVMFDQITVGDIRVLVLDSDPSTGAGYQEAVGSVASVPSTGVLYVKFGTGVNDWSMITTQAVLTEQVQDIVGAFIQDSATIDATYNDAGNIETLAVIQSGIDHGSISGLADDDHAQYLLLAGRAGGQNARGGTAASENLTLSSTANATKGKILLGANVAVDEANTRLGIGTATPLDVVHVNSNGAHFRVRQAAVTTANSTATTLISGTPPSDSVTLMTVFIQGRNPTTGAIAVYKRTFSTRNVAGTLTLGTIQSDYTHEDLTMALCNVSIAVAGTSYNVQVTGLAATTLNWTASMEISY